MRMVYTLGNHDLIKGYKDAQGRDYGEKPYEDQFGPLTMYGNVESGCDNWKWSHSPWPWQNY